MSYKYQVDILVNGRPVSMYDHNSQIFIEGRPSSQYEIKIQNKTHRRVKAVVSVDGLSILDGEPASETGKGYVVNAYSTIVLKGWRISDTQVREFVFGNKKQSYSNKSGNGTQNTGVIGVVFIPEKQYYYSPSLSHTFTSNERPIWNNYNYQDHLPTSWSVDGVSPLRSMAMNSMVGSALAASASYSSDSEQNTRRINTSAVNNLGTEMGQAVHSETRTVTFDPDMPQKEVYVIYYDDRRGLEARGIVVNPRYQNPDPFPASNGYCKQV